MFLGVSEILIIALLLGVFVYLSYTTPKGPVSTKKNTDRRGFMEKYGFYIYVGVAVLSLLVSIMLGVKYHKNLQWLLVKIPFISSYFITADQRGGGDVMMPGSLDEAVMRSDARMSGGYANDEESFNYDYNSDDMSFDEEDMGIIRE